MSAHGRERKNFLPSILLMVVLWGIVFFIILLVDPAIVRDVLWNDSYLPFFVPFFGALFLTLGFLFGAARVGLLGAFGLTFFLYLRIVGLGNVVNALLLVTLLISLEVYWRHTHV